MGYSPACSNLWKPGLCDRRHVKCSECPNRNLHAIGGRTLIRHFVGSDLRRKDVLGLYPMTKDSTCWLLVTDFDDDGWQKTAGAYRDACRRRGLFCAVERSWSGCGAHVWLFFQAEVPAAKAHTLGTLLLDDARRHYSRIGFDSYDRLFPTQDAIASDGLGNLIALSLRGVAVREGNGVFVDDAFEPYDNQGVFLSTVKKVPAAVVHGLADGYVVPGMGGGKSRWSSEKNAVIQNDLATQNGATVADSAAPEIAAAQCLTSLQVDVTLDGMVQLRKYQLPQPLLADLS